MGANIKRQSVERYQYSETCDELGRGAFGIVYRVRDTMSQNEM